MTWIVPENIINQNQQPTIKGNNTVKKLQITWIAFLFSVGTLPANADATFKTNYTSDRPDAGAIAKFACTDKSNLKDCNDEAITFALAYCSAASTYYRKSTNELSRSDIFMFGLATLATVAGASNLATAKLWGLLGGATGINIGWSKLTDPMAKDLNSEAHTIDALETHIRELSPNDIKSTTDYALTDVHLQALGYATQCTAPAATPAAAPADQKAS